MPENAHYRLGGFCIECERPIVLLCPKHNPMLAAQKAELKAKVKAIVDNYKFWTISEKLIREDIKKQIEAI